MVEKKLIEILLDDRERKLIEIFRSKENPIVEAIVGHLDVGDVVISDKMALERKEGYDYVQSLIKNDHLFEQLTRLEDVYENSVLVLEGLNESVFRNIGVKASSIYGSLTKIIDMGISIVPTVNLEHTAILIERMAIRERKKKDGSTLLARSAPKKMSELERRSFIVQGFVDTGPNKAKTLVERFGTVQGVLDAIRDTEIVYTRTGREKGIVGPLNELKGFGASYLKKIFPVLFGENINIPEVEGKSAKRLVQKTL